MEKLKTEEINKIFKLKSIRELVSGNILLHPIFRDDGLMLVNKYTKLTQLYTEKINLYCNENFMVIVAENIENFQKFLVHKIFESDEYIEAITKVADVTKKFSTVPVSVELYLGTKIKKKVISEENKEINEEYNFIINTLASTPLWNYIENITEAPMAQERIKNTKKILIERISCDNQLLGLLRKMNEYDELLILHNINKLSLSLIIGTCLELEEDKLIELCFCALFSSIGFLNMEQAEYHGYLRKKVHNELAEKIISNSISILSKTEIGKNKNIIYGILDQYEAYNGTGAPIKKKGEDISAFGRILYIASTYERLVNGYFANSVFSHNEAIDIMWNDEKHVLDIDIIKIYIYRTNIYKIGQSTLFYFGKPGIIIGFRNYVHAPNYPIVKYSDGTIIDYYGK